MKSYLAILLAVLTLFSAGCGTPKTGSSAAPEIKVDYFSSSSGLPHEHITCLAVFGGQVWAGTKKGLARYDGVNWQIHVKKNTSVLRSDIIEGMAVGDNGIYIATDNGVIKFDGNNWNSVFTGSRARCVAVKGPEIAVATAHGIEHTTGGSTFQPKAKDNAGLLYDEVNIVAFDKSGKLWAGMPLGMACLNGMMFANHSGPAKTIMGSSLVEVPPSPPTCQLIGNNINCILPYKGMLAIGTTSGLSITDMENSWRSYTAQHKDWFQRGGNIVEETVSGNSPIPGNSIGALAATKEDKILFVGTSKGLSALQDTTWIDVQSKLPALKPGPVSALAVQDNILWVGTPIGLFKVNGFSALVP